MGVRLGQFACFVVIHQPGVWKGAGEDYEKEQNMQLLKRANMGITKSVNYSPGACPNIHSLTSYIGIYKR